MTSSTTSAASGLASSRFGPTLPDEPAASSVWQPPQPAEAKIFSPAAGSPLGCSGGRLRLPLPGLGAGRHRLGPVLFLLFCEEDDAGDRADEEHDCDEHE